MNIADIIRYRLINQQIAGTVLTTPGDIVHRMIAMQAQEFALAKWAIGLRLPGSNDAIVEQAFQEGAILRTHVMRPTWHFVIPADIRWLLALTAPRVHAVNAFMYRKLELTPAVFKKSNNILIKTLEGEKQLTRVQLQAALERKKLVADGMRLAYLLMYAELEGIICSGPRQGKQFTYMLLDERVSPVKQFTREETLVNFTRRYFASRGPATLRDFTYWSGLTMKDAKAGAAGLPAEFERVVLNGQEYIFLPLAPGIKNTRLTRMQATFLLPDYDEYGMSYKDRSALFDAANVPVKSRRDHPVFNHMMVIDGVIAGTWQRTVKNNTVMVETTPFNPLSGVKQQAVKNAVKKYRLFTGNEKEK